MRALAKRREDRFQTMADMAQAIVDIQNNPEAPKEWIRRTWPKPASIH